MAKNATTQNPVVTPTTIERLFDACLWQPSDGRAIRPQLDKTVKLSDERVQALQEDIKRLLRLLLVPSTQADIIARCYRNTRANRTRSRGNSFRKLLMLGEAIGWVSYPSDDHVESVGILSVPQSLIQPAYKPVPRN